MFGMSIIEQLSVQIEMGMAVVSPPHAAVVVQVVVVFKNCFLLKTQSHMPTSKTATNYFTLSYVPSVHHPTLHVFLEPQEPWLFVPPPSMNFVGSKRGTNNKRKGAAPALNNRKKAKNNKSSSSTTATTTTTTRQSTATTSDPFEIVTPANTYRNLRQIAFSTAFSTSTHDAWFKEDHPELLQAMEEALKQTPRPSASSSSEPGGGRGKSNHHRPRQQQSTQTIEEKMKAHNQKFRKKKPTYEPRKHSARDVRLWEKKTKKKWSNLTVDERISANAAITKMVQLKKKR